MATFLRLQVIILVMYNVNLSTIKLSLNFYWWIFQIFISDFILLLLLLLLLLLFFSFDTLMELIELPYYWHMVVH